MRRSSNAAQLGLQLILGLLLSWSTNEFRLDVRERSIAGTVGGEAAFALPLRRPAERGTPGALEAQALFGGSALKLTESSALNELAFHAGTRMSLELGKGLQVAAAGRAGSSSISGEAELRLSL